MYWPIGWCKCWRGWGLNRSHAPWGKFSSLVSSFNSTLAACEHWVHQIIEFPPFPLSISLRYNSSCQIESNAFLKSMKETNKDCFDVHIHQLVFYRVEASSKRPYWGWVSRASVMFVQSTASSNDHFFLPNQMLWRLNSFTVHFDDCIEELCIRYKDFLPEWSSSFSSSACLWFTQVRFTSFKRWISVSKTFSYFRVLNSVLL